MDIEDRTAKSELDLNELSEMFVSAAQANLRMAGKLYPIAITWGPEGIGVVPLLQPGGQWNDPDYRRAMYAILRQFLVDSQAAGVAIATEAWSYVPKFPEERTFDIESAENFWQELQAIREQSEEEFLKHVDRTEVIFLNIETYVGRRTLMIPFHRKGRQFHFDKPLDMSDGDVAGNATNLLPPREGAV